MSIRSLVSFRSWPTRNSSDQGLYLGHFSFRNDHNHRDCVGFEADKLAKICSPLAAAKHLANSVHSTVSDFPGSNALKLISFGTRFDALRPQFSPATYIGFSTDGTRRSILFSGSIVASIAVLIESSQ